MFNLHKENGQSLIEVLVVLTISLMVLVALVALVIIGLKNAQFAQNQNKATQYAQQAMDQIKTIKDRNSTVNFTYGSNITSNFVDLWGIEMSKNCAPCSFVLDSPQQLVGDASDLNASQDLGLGLSRQIIISDGSDFATVKTVVVKVKWTDSAGEHESNLQTILTNK